MVIHVPLVTYLRRGNQLYGNSGSFCFIPSPMVIHFRRGFFLLLVIRIPFVLHA